MPPTIPNIVFSCWFVSSDLGGNNLAKDIFVYLEKEVELGKAWVILNLSVCSKLKILCILCKILGLCLSSSK